jgi:hypothetical protein
LNLPWRGRIWRAGNHRMFDPALALDRHSPGVIPERRPFHTVAGVYDPDDVDEAVRASWGIEPLAPCTFREPARRTPIRTPHRA